jgi:hypothetical protein
MPRRAFSYGRVSNHQQVKGSGLDRQQGQLDNEEPWFDRVCREQGWQPHDERLTDKGRSGFHKRNLRPKAALTRFLKWMESGRVSKGDVLVVDKLDRLTRAELDEAEDLFKKILRGGAWICTKEPFRISKCDPDKPREFMDVMEPLWIMYCNWLESKKKQDNMRAAWKKLRHGARTAKKPHQAPPPWWIRRAGDAYATNDRLRVLETMLGLARQGRPERGEGPKGARQIADSLEEMKVPSPHGKARWSRSSVLNTLRNRALVGEFQPHEYVNGKRVPVGEPIPGYYPPVLQSEEEWQELQMIIDKRTKGKRGRPSKGAVNILASLVHDAVSREHLTLGHQPQGIRYLGRASQRKGLLVPYERLASWVLQTVAMLRPADVIDRPQETAALEEEIACLAARFTALSLREQQLQNAAADPGQDLGMILPVLRQVVDEKKAVAAERDRLKLESKTGKAEALAEVQETVKAMRDATTGEARAELDGRIAFALPDVVSEIWLQQQRLSEKRSIFHVQVWLRNGSMRYFQLPPSKLPAGVRPWQLGPDDGWDLRRGPYVPAGDHGHVAAVAEPA